MPIKKIFTFFTLIILFFLPLSASPVFSESLDTSQGTLDNINKQLSDLTDSLSKSVAATKPLESQLQSMTKQIEGIKQQVVLVEQDSALKQKEIDAGYKDLASKEEIISRTIRASYIKSYYDSPLLILLSINDIADITQALAYERAKTQEDKAVLTNIALAITDLENKKTQLEQEQKWLVSTKANLDVQSAKLDKIVSDAKAYQSEVSAKIAELSAQQQGILNARSGGFTATIGDSDQADDYNASIKGFRETAPSGSFAVFSFGAYTHRKGMSQYGAFGRANSGQDYHTILKAYYGKDTSTADTGGTIKVNGFGDIDFETTYLYGIAEMPSSFPVEALKAQAIAARSYAYRYKKDGTSICADEGCQVYSSSKSANPPDAWKQAVDATKGQIIDGVTTFFSSTAGGYLSTSGWDTTDSNGGGNFADRAYEKIAGSPWFYKAWYRKGYSNTGDTCGKSTPWLSPTDMADIVNAYLVLTHGDGSETSRISPITTSCWGGNPYSIDELRSIASKYGGISSADSVSVTQGNGTTSTVTINGVSMNGSDFQKAFNLRASGYMRIPQTGFAFFNIEHK